MPVTASRLTLIFMLCSCAGAPSPVAQVPDAVDDCNAAEHRARARWNDAAVHELQAQLSVGALASQPELPQLIVEEVDRTMRSWAERRDGLCALPDDGEARRRVLAQRACLERVLRDVDVHLERLRRPTRFEVEAPTAFMEYGNDVDDCIVGPIWQRYLSDERTPVDMPEDAELWAAASRARVAVYVSDEETVREAVAELNRLAPAGHSAAARAQAVQFSVNLAWLEGDSRAALAAAESFVAAFDEPLARDSANVLHLSALASVESLFGETERNYELRVQQSALIQRLANADHWDAAASELRAAGLAATLERHEAASEHLDNARRMLLASRSDTHPRFAALRYREGLLELRRDDHEQAKRSIGAAETLWRRRSGAMSSHALMARHMLGRVARMRGDYVEAGRVLRETLADHQRFGGPEDKALIWVLWDLGVLEEWAAPRGAGREDAFERAEAFLARGSRLIDLDPYPGPHGGTTFDLRRGLLAARRGRWAAALELARRGRSRGELDPRFRRIALLALEGRALLRLGRPAEALSPLETALSLSRTEEEPEGSPYHQAHLGLALFQSGDEEGGRVMLDAAAARSEETADLVEELRARIHAAAPHGERQAAP